MGQPARNPVWRHHPRHNQNAIQAIHQQGQPERNPAAGTTRTQSTSRDNQNAIQQQGQGQLKCNPPQAQLERNPGNPPAGTTRSQSSLVAPPAVTTRTQSRVVAPPAGTTRKKFTHPRHNQNAIQCCGSSSRDNQNTIQSRATSRDNQNAIQQKGQPGCNPPPGTTRAQSRVVAPPAGTTRTQSRQTSSRDNQKEIQCCGSSSRDNQNTI